jgi:hypothetical protein
VLRRISTVAAILTGLLSVVCSPVQAETLRLACVYESGAFTGERLSVAVDFNSSTVVWAERGRDFGRERARRSTISSSQFLPDPAFLEGKSTGLQVSSHSITLTMDECRIGALCSDFLVWCVREQRAASDFLFDIFEAWPLRCPSGLVLRDMAHLGRSPKGWKALPVVYEWSGYKRSHSSI